MSPILDLLGGDKSLLISHVPHARAIGMTVRDVEPRKAWLTVPYSERLVGNPETRVVSGGVITTLLDNAAGIAVMMTLDDPKSIATLDLRIDYMKPATPERDIVGYSHCYKLTRNIAFVRGLAYHEDPDDPIATSVSTFMIAANPAPPAALARS